MLVIFEGLVFCFLVLLTCVAAIADGPVGAVVFYEPEVQKRVAELGLTTKVTIRRRKSVIFAALLIPMLVLVPLAVYLVNGARGFMEPFIQMTIIYLIEGLFDRLFIDWYWVGKTKAWLIPGTEDLMPYVPKKTMIRKSVATVIGCPMIAAIIASIGLLFATV